MTKNQILKRAIQICDMLARLQGKAKDLIFKIRHQYNGEDLNELEEVLYNLYSFDLDDAVSSASEVK